MRPQAADAVASEHSCAGPHPALRATLPARRRSSPCAKATVNICCVGDDDQSIYGWRGAEVDNILRFDKDFPGATVIRLERNYRSTAHILGAASHLIAHNEGRLGKTLFTDRVDPEDAKVNVHAAWDSEEEARAVGEEIEQAQRSGHMLNDMAILVRASFQMREFEDRFVTLGLNYRVIGGPRFYERQEIRDALAYLPRRRARRRRPRLRAHRQRAEARPRRSHHPPDPRHRARAAHADAGGRRQARRERRAEAEAARRAARGRRQFRALAEACSKPRRTPSSPRSSWRRAATPRCGRTTARPKRRAGWKT